MKPLPNIMVAPNGGRRTKQDHRALPITIDEIVQCAVDCHAAGATGIHAHVRDDHGQHVLDAGLYAELLSECARVVPGMQVQITTEAVGRYLPREQRILVESLRPSSVSIALREILQEADTAVTRRFFAFCDEAEIAVQHILYDADEVDLLKAHIADGLIPVSGLQVLHVLGRYSPGQVSSPTDLDLPLARQHSTGLQADWAVCAFGADETACLVQAVSQGGKARIGFENNLLDEHGQPAQHNAARVLELIARLQAMDVGFSNS